MASAVHPCGCVFDADFVDEKHHEGEGQTHYLKGKLPVAEVKADEVKVDVKPKGFFVGKKHKEEKGEDS